MARSCPDPVPRKVIGIAKNWKKQLGTEAERFLQKKFYK
jgi:hypothetical protein